MFQEWSEWQQVPGHPGFEWSKSFPAGALKLRTLARAMDETEPSYVETPAIYCADSIEVETGEFHERLWAEGYAFGAGVAA